jgi:hypothetical protein
MAKQEITLLAKRLDLLRSRLDELWDSTTDADARKDLQQQYDDLDKAVMRLISVAVKDNGKEYDAAVAALGKANTTLKAALDDEEQFVKAIESVAQALDLVTKVIAIA